MTGYQFFRFHSLASHAEPNLVAMRYDDAVMQGAGSKVRIDRYFKDQGWITMMASAKCEINEYDIEKDEHNK